MRDFELSESTIKQRRNLIANSALLILIHHAEIEFGESLKVFGTSLHVGNPDFLYTGLLLSECYFLWRFFQYFVIDKAFYQVRSEYKDHLATATRMQIIEIVRKATGATGFSGEAEYKNLDRVGLNYELSVKESGGGGPQIFNPNNEHPPEKLLHVVMPVWSIELKRAVSTLGFTFRSRMVSDFFVPWLFAVYVGFLAIQRVA